MSESEKILRDRYQATRRKRIMLLSAIAVVLILLTLISAFTFTRLRSISFSEYSDIGSAVYHAYLDDNEFYSQESLNGSHAYVASLIKYMTADFRYEMHTDTQVYYKYYYSVDIIIEVRDKNTGMTIYDPTFSVVPRSFFSSEDTELVIKKHIEFDYNKYNDIAKDFVQTYNLSETVCSLTARMSVLVTGEGGSLNSNTQDEYNIDVTIPLLQTVVAPTVSTSIPTSTKVIIAGDTRLREAFRIIAIVSGVLSALMIFATYIFIIKTRDKHLDYSHKVSRLLSNYKSYIQRVQNDYDPGSRQMLRLGDFAELIEIRDTLQSPILMFENEDRTYSKFFIITESIVYYYDIQVIDD